MTQLIQQLLFYLLSSGKWLSTGISDNGDKRLMKGEVSDNPGQTIGGGLH
jgi:hypothetical protein